MRQFRNISHEKPGNNNILTLVILGLVFLLCICCSAVFTIYSINNPTFQPTALSNASDQSESPIQTQIADLVNTQKALITEPVSPTTIPDVILTTVPIIQTQPGTSIVSGTIQVTFIDVGQGDSILIKSPEGKYGLIDGGEEGSGSLEYLQSHGVTSLDLVVATHPHSDHIGGLVGILKTIPVSRIVTNGQAHTTGVYESFLDAALATKAEYSEVKRGDFISLGNLNFDVLSPETIAGEDLNINSIVLRMVYGKTSFLFMGDANKITDEDILASGVQVVSTILKIGHHASATSLSSNFIPAVHPEVAIYSAGKGNDYDHPAASIIDSISATGTKVFGTDSSGTIVVSADGSTYSIQREKETTPTQAPIIAAVAPQIVDASIKVIELSSPITAGDTASISIQTAPNANCSISVVYKSGPSSAAGLGPQVADQNGQVSWSWKVGSRTTAGKWNINTNCDKDGKSSSLSIPFEVVK